MASQGENSDVLVTGARVEVNGNRGTLRFVGTTEFASGRWVGIELDSAVGKNDGSVMGKRYFTCEPLFGVFVRASQVRLVAPDAESSADPTAIAASGSTSPILSPRKLQSPTPGKSRIAPPSAVTSTPRPSSLSSSARVASGIKQPNSVIPASTRASAATSLASDTSSVSASAPVPAVSSRIIQPRIPSTPSSRVASTSVSRTATRSPTIPSSSSNVRSTPTARTTDSAAAPPPTGSVQTVGLTGSRPRPMMPTTRSTSSSRFTTPSVSRLPSARQSAENIPILRDDGARQLAASSESAVSDYADASEAPTPPKDLAADASTTDYPGETALTLSASSLSPIDLVDSLTSVYRSAPTVQTRELETRLKVLEKQRADDRDRIKDMERVKADLQASEREKDRLAAKVTDLLSSLSSMREQLAQSHQTKDDLEKKLADSMENLELAIVDKDVAEERVAVLESEMEELQDKVEELKIEVEVLQEQALSASPSTHGSSIAGDRQAPTSTGSVQMVQLEKQNERLREALVKLRDVAAQQETDHKQKIAAAEKEAGSLREYKEKYETFKPQFDAAQRAIEELKDQLDDALAAEDVVVQLTDKNLFLGEKVEELQTELEELEALKGLSDELEESHIETERQLQAEIDVKSGVIREQSQMIEKAAETLADYEKTILQFRELVRSLQSDIISLREAVSVSQSIPTFALASQSHEMVRLTLKLEGAATDVKTKQIELDLRRLEAQQAVEELNLIKPYLPDEIIFSEAPSIQCLLAFRRLAFKSDMVAKFLEEEGARMRKAINANVVEVVAAERAAFIVQMRRILLKISTISQQFSACIAGSSVEEFMSFGKVHSELVGTERRMDGLVSILKASNLEGSFALQDAEKTQTALERIAKVYLRTEMAEPACRKLEIVAWHTGIELCADSIEAEIARLRAIVPENLRHKLLVELDERFVKNVGSMKVFARKIRSALEDRQQKTWARKFVAKIQAIHALASSSISPLLQVSLKLSTEIADRGEVPQGSTLAAVLQSVLGDQAWLTVTHTMSETVKELAKLSDELANQDDWDDIPTITAPWILRALELRKAYLSNSESHKMNSELSEQLSAALLELQKSDRALQEQQVRSELLNSRLLESKKLVETIEELENKLSSAEEENRGFDELVQTLQSEVETLQNEANRLKKINRGGGKQLGLPRRKDDYDNSADMGEETSYNSASISEHVEVLRAALRHLQSENARLLAQRILSVAGGASFLLDEEDPVSRYGRPLDPQKSGVISESGKLQSLRERSRILGQDVRELRSTAEIIDLSAVSDPVAQWRSSKRDPVFQCRQRKAQAEKLGSRFAQLRHEVSAWEARMVGVTSLPSPPRERTLLGRLVIPSADEGRREVLALNQTAFESVHSVFVM